MIRAFLKLNLILLLLAFSGCALLAPDRQDPKVDLPERWSESGMSSESDLALVAWWYKFNDQNLNRLIESGLYNSNSIAKAQANIEEAQGQLRSVELGWIPSIALFSGVMNVMPLLPQAQTLYGAYVGYSSLNIFSQIAQQKASKLNMLAQQKAYQGAKLDLITNIALSYYTLIASQNEYKLYQQYVSDLQQKLKLYKEKKNGGLSSAVDGVNLAQTLNQTLSQLKAIEYNLIKSQNALNYLLNNNPGTVYPSSDFSKVKTTYANVYALPATIIGNRPDVAVAAYQFKYAAQQVTVAYTQLLPSFQMVYGPTAISGGGIPGLANNYTATYQDEFVLWSLNPAIFGNISEFSGAAKYCYVNYIDTVRGALKEVANDLANNRIINQRYVLIKQAAADAQYKYQLSYTMYKNGLKAYADTFADKISVDEAQISLNQMKLSQMQAIISLYKNLAGGYRFKESQTLSVAGSTSNSNQWQ